MDPDGEAIHTARGRALLVLLVEVWNGWRQCLGNAGVQLFPDPVAIPRVDRSVIVIVIVIVIIKFFCLYWISDRSSVTVFAYRSTYSGEYLQRIANR